MRATHLRMTSAGRRSALTKAALSALLTAVCTLGIAPAGEAGFVEWVESTYSLAVADHFTQVNQVHTGLTQLVLHHDVSVTVAISEPQMGGSRLRCGTSGSTDALDTSYKLSGTRLSPNDSDWIAAATFVGRSYTLTPLTGQPYTSTIQLDVQAANAQSRANDAGPYTATITLTATSLP